MSRDLGVLLTEHDPNFALGSVRGNYRIVAVVSSGSRQMPMKSRPAHAEAWHNYRSWNNVHSDNSRAPAPNFTLSERDHALRRRELRTRPPCKRLGLRWWHIRRRRRASFPLSLFSGAFVRSLCEKLANRESHKVTQIQRIKTFCARFRVRQTTPILCASLGNPRREMTRVWDPARCVLSTR
jgi:hypothetical protein